MDDPVNPATTFTPSLAAARAVSCISLAARARTPSGLPSPQTCAGMIDLWRSSMASQTAWPTRWLLIAKTFRPCFASRSRRPWQ